MCPDAKAYPGGLRPSMKTSSGGRTCRNTACEKYKKPEDKPEVKSEAAKLTPKPKSRSGRCPKHYLDRLKSLEVKHLKTEELEPLELDLEAYRHLVSGVVLKLYAEAGEEEAERLD